MTRRPIRARAFASALALGAVATLTTPALASAGANLRSTAPDAAIDAVDGVVDITQNRVRVSGKQQFSYHNEIIYWSVTGVRPVGKTKADLSLYADSKNRELLTSSKQTGKTVDIVVVDSNHALSPNDWYPTVTQKGAGSYDVQNDTDGDLLRCNNNKFVDFGPGDVVWITDVFVRRNTRATITLTNDGDGDAQLLLFRSSEPAQQTWYQSRSEAFKVSDGDGGREEIQFDGESDLYGLVIAQSSGSGRYSVTATCVELD